MKQFRVLLGIQMAAIGVKMSGSGTAGKRARKPVLGNIGMALIWAMAGLSVMVMFGSTFALIAEPFHTMGFDWLYMTLAMLLCSLIMLVGTVFLAKSQLFESKDNNLLLVMPIPPFVILLVRMTSLYLMNLIWGATVILPALVCRFMTVGFSVGFLLRGILLYVLLALFVLALSCLLGWILARIAARIRNKTFVTVALSLAFIAGYYYVIGTGSNRLMELLLHESEMFAKMLGSVVPLYWIGDAAANGSPLSLFLSVLMLSLPIIPVYLVLAKTFIRTVTASRGFSRIRYDEAKHSGSISGADTALLKRDNALLLSSSIYLLNSGLGVVFLAAGAVIALVKYDTIAPMLAILGADMIPAIFCGMAAMMLSMVLFTPPSVSLDAKTLWILRSMPVSGAQILLSKWKLHLIWCALPILMSSAVGTLFFARSAESAAELAADPMLSGMIRCVSLSLFDRTVLIAVLFILPQLYSAVSGGVGLLIGLRFPCLKWTNETQVVKQSMAVLADLLANFALAGIPALTVYYLRNQLPIAVLLLLWTVLFALGLFAVYRLIIGWGVRTLEKLSV